MRPDCLHGHNQRVAWPHARVAGRSGRQINKDGTTKNEGGKKHIINTCTWLSATPDWLFHACSVICLYCLTLVGTDVLLYVCRCSMQGRLKADLLLFLRYVDTVAFGAWFVPSYGVRRRKAGSKTKTS